MGAVRILHLASRMGGVWLWLSFDVTRMVLHIPISFSRWSLAESGKGKGKKGINITTWLVALFCTYFHVSTAQLSRQPIRKAFWG